MMFATLKLIACSMACLAVVGAASGDAIAEHQWTPANFDALAEIVAGVSTEGLDPSRYPIAAASAARAAGDIETADALATAIFFAVAQDFARGGTPAADRLRWRIEQSEADKVNVDELIAVALKRGRVRESLTKLLPTHPQYQALKRALATIASEDTEKASRIKANLERWRWMPRSLGPSYVFVNVPSQELAVIRNGAEIDRRRVIYGARKTPTWQFSATITGVSFNPTWYVPKSIAAADGIDALLRQRPKIANSLGYYIAEDGGVRQKPGPRNSLGRVKLIMPNQFSTYLHDTPNQSLFDRETRAFSHGCIRVEGALEFVRVLLEPKWTADAIAAVVATNSTVVVELDAPLPVHVAYFTATVSEDGAVTFFPDVYGLDKLLIGSLHHSAKSAEPSSGQLVSCGG